MELHRRTAWLDETRSPPDLVVVEGGFPSFIDRDRSADGLQDPTPTARSLAESLASMFGPTTRAILHYGSRAQGRASRADSAFDFFIIVDGYRQAYRALAANLGMPHHPNLAIVLARVLPPNAISVRHRGPHGEYEAKCVIASTPHFRRECSSRARDHFFQGRVSQCIVLVWSRDPESAELVLHSVREARERSFAWARVFLPRRFDLELYCRTLLEVALAHEIRPEAKNHADTLFAVQRDTLMGTYGPVLARLQDRGVLARDGDAFVQRRLPGPIVKLRVRTYFRFSKLRTTLRLLKHPLLYDGWLDYLVRKIDRSTGERIELTARERRWPLIFLWPRALRYLRTRPQHQR